MWNPELYLKFSDERSQPFYDLLNMVKPFSGGNIVDLGCGTGHLTAHLAEKFPSSKVLGVDNSATMLQKALRLTTSKLGFELADISQHVGRYDLIISNAALHWIDHHADLLPRLWSNLKLGGQIAVQMPNNHNHPSHKLIRELTRREPYRSALGYFEFKTPVLDATDYANILYSLGGVNIEVYERVYTHLLPDYHAVLDWVKGTSLLVILGRLSPAMQADFLRDLTRDYQKQFPQTPIFYTYKRLFFYARRSDELDFDLDV